MLPWLQWLPPRAPTAPHAAATLAFSSGTPAAICRRQAWAVKHRDPELLGPLRLHRARSRWRSLLRGFTARLKKDEAEDQTPGPPPPPACSARLHFVASRTFRPVEPAGGSVTWAAAGFYLLNWAVTGLTGCHGCWWLLWRNIKVNET